MKKNSKRSQRNSEPLLSFPHISQQNMYCYISPKPVKVYEFNTISNGYQRTFTEQDALKEYGKQVILAPEKVSYMNLFVNAVLQPKENYVVEDGKLTLLTEDIPISGTPIHLQMIKI